MSGFHVGLSNGDNDDKPLGLFGLVPKFPHKNKINIYCRYKL